MRREFLAGLEKNFFNVSKPGGYSVETARRAISTMSWHWFWLRPQAALLKMRHYATLPVLFMLALAASSMLPVATPGALARKAVASDPTANAVAAAKAFLATLDETKRAKASVSFTSEYKTRWSNLPTGIVMQSGAAERSGVKLGDMTPDQRKAALALVAATLSPTGYRKVMNIVTADEVLETETAPKRAADSRIRFGKAEYYVAILGAPSVAEPWMIQFGGHHLAINVTVVGKNNVLTPSHTGAQPSKYTLNGETVRPLGGENDKAFALINALDASQRKQAILDYQVADTVLGPGQDGKVIQPEGVKASAFTSGQQRMLLDLINEWVGILHEDAAAAKLAEIKGNLKDTYFAWSGPTTNGSGAYFRIQGPTVMIEYAPQGRGANTDHIHTFYRDPTNDYGAKLIKP